jgi:hypothetical protein
MPGVRNGHIVTGADLTDGLGLITRKLIDESVTSNTTLQDDDELSILVGSNTVYVMDGYIIYSGVSDAGTGAGGLKMQFTGPAGASMTWTNFGGNVAVPSNTPAGNPFTGTQAYNMVAEGLAAGSPRSVPTNGAGVIMSCRPTGVLTTGANAGNLLLRWAQFTSSATATIVRANSWIRLQKII